jgi:hypothetical protein
MNAGCIHREEHEGHEEAGRTGQEFHIYFSTSGS